MRSVLSYLNIQSKKKMRRVFILAIVAVLTPVLLFINFMQHLLARPSELEIRLNLQPDTYRSGFSWHGAGLTWQNYPPSNLLKNHQFAAYTPKIIEPVWQKTEESLIFALHQKFEGEQLDSSWLGAKVRLLPFGQSGLSNSRETSVQAIEPVLLQNIRSLQDLPEQARIEKITSIAHRTNADGGVLDSVAVGEKGYVLYNPHLVQTQVVGDFTSESFRAVVANSNGYAVLTEKGQLWLSNDGKHWQSLELAEALPYTRLAATNEDFLAWKKDGSLLQIRRDRRLKKHMVRGLDETSACLATEDTAWLSLHDGRWLHLAADLTYQDGIKIKEDSAFMRLKLGAVARFGSVTYLLTRDGHVYVGDMQSGFSWWTKESLREASGLNLGSKRTSFLDLQFFVIGQQQVLVLLPDQGLWHYDQSQEKWLKVDHFSGGGQTQVADLLPRGIFLTAQTSGLHSNLIVHQLTVGIRLTDENFMQSLQAGSSLLFTREQDSDQQLLIWQPGEKTLAEVVHTRDSSIKTNDRTAEDFSDPISYLHLRSVDSTKGISLSQDFAIRPETWPERRVFRLSWQARSKGTFSTQSPADAADSAPVANGTLLMQDHSALTLSITGDIPAQHFRLPKLSTEWQTYSFDFVTSQPDDFGPDQVKNLTLTLSSSLERLDVSDFYIGERDSRSNGMSSYFSAYIREQKPAILRINGLSIGRSGRPAMDWLDPQHAWSYSAEAGMRAFGGISLVSALELAAESSSSPWIMLNPYATTEEVQALLEYIAGPVYSTYGRKRQQDGRTPPWSLAFARIYLEFGDQDGRLETDKDRGDMVDLLLRYVKSSPYYSELKNKLVFVDGMDYGQNEKLSAAEEHATQLPQGFALGLSAEETYQALLSIFPRHAFFPEPGNREQISQMFLVDVGGQPLRFARLLESALVGLGRITSSVNFALDGFAMQGESSRLSGLLQLLQPRISGSHLLTMERSVLPGNEGKTERLDKIGSHGVLAPDSSFSLYFTNDNQEEAVIYLEITDEIEGDLHESIYAANGVLLYRENRQAKAMQIRIPAGGVVVLEGRAK